MPVAVVAWIVWNLTRDEPLDAPPFFWLQGTLALYAARTLGRTHGVEFAETHEVLRIAL